MLEELRQKAIEVYGADPYDASRKRECVWARQAVFNSLIKEGWSSRRIETEFNKDHATVIYSQKTHRNLLQCDTQYIRLFNLFSPREIVFTPSSYKKTVRQSLKTLLECESICVTEETPKIFVDVAVEAGIKIIRG